eukprot:scaffold1535_cov382-Prasinococcus_capsulatus_cf.AAC.61
MQGPTAAAPAPDKDNPVSTAAASVSGPNRPEPVPVVLRADATSPWQRPVAACVLPTRGLPSEPYVVAAYLGETGMRCVLCFGATSRLIDSCRKGLSRPPNESSNTTLGAPDPQVPHSRVGRPRWYGVESGLAIIMIASPLSTLACAACVLAQCDPSRGPVGRGGLGLEDRGTSA